VVYYEQGTPAWSCPHRRVETKSVSPLRSPGGQEQSDPYRWSSFRSADRHDRYEPWIALSRTHTCSRFSISEQLLGEKMKRFRGGLVCKADRLLYHSSLSLRVIKKKKNTCSHALYPRQTRRHHGGGPSSDPLTGMCRASLSRAHTLDHPLSLSALSRSLALSPLSLSRSLAFSRYRSSAGKQISWTRISKADGIS